MKQRVTPEPAYARGARYTQMSDHYDYLGGTAEALFRPMGWRRFFIFRSEKYGRF